MDSFITIPLWPEKSPVLNDGVNDGEMPVMEFYRSTLPVPDAGRKRPAMVIFPGGAYHHRAHHEGHDVALCFNDLGFNCFVVEYRINPHLYPAPQQDAFRAIQLVRVHAEEYDIDPEQVATIGFSAGGHLSACTANMANDPTTFFRTGEEADTMSRLPNACGLAYAVLSADYRIANIGTFSYLLGPGYRERMMGYDMVSRISDTTPPTFMWHTVTDNGVDYQNTLRYMERMHEKGLTVEAHLFPQGGHGLGLAPEYADISQWPSLYRQFLRTTCKFNC